MKSITTFNQSICFPLRWPATLSTDLLQCSVFLCCRSWMERELQWKIGPGLNSSTMRKLWALHMIRMEANLTFPIQPRVHLTHRNQACFQHLFDCEQNQFARNIFMSKLKKTHTLSDLLFICWESRAVTLLPLRIKSSLSLAGIILLIKWNVPSR